MKWMIGSGLDEYIGRLNDFLDDDYIKAAVYPAAGIVAREIRANIEKLPTMRGKSPHVTGVTKVQKEGLLEGFGISSFANWSGYVHVKLGFDGYNEKEAWYYPNGQPNAMIARSIEGGTSWSDATPFVRPAVNKTKEIAELTMKENIDQTIYSIFK